MRVTSTSSYITMRDSLAGTLGRVQDVQAQLGTGRRINKPSDDPVGSATALRYRSYEADQKAYSASADDAITRLTASDTALQSMSSALRRVRELAVAGGSAALSREARAAHAEELESLSDFLADLANTTHDGQALFGGHAGTAVARRADGSWSYAGDAGKVLRRVGAGVTMPVNTDGQAAFGFDQPPGEDLFSVVDRLATAARTGDPAGLRYGQAALATRTTALLGALGSVGATTNGVEAARARGEQFIAQIVTERSQIEDLDLAEAVLQLTAARTGYEAALGAVAKANLPSLADFLR